MLAVVVAVRLAPASILSSTSVISSALILGTETLSQQADQNRQMSSLNSKLNRLEIRVSQAWADYRDECDRGGCGDIADGLKAEALELESKIRTARDQIGILQAQRPLSTFTSRTVETLQTFGFRQDEMKWLMPIFLALTSSAALKVDGQKIWFKIGAYDQNLEYGSPDPSDPAVTKRVMTILLPSEY